MYPKLSGMTGTALTEAAEFSEIYKLEVVEIPTNVPVARKDADDEIYRTLGDKTRAIVKLVEECRSGSSRCWSVPYRSRSPRSCRRR